MNTIKIRCPHCTHIVELDDSAIGSIAKITGRQGGNKTATRGPEYYAEIGRKGAAKRWKK